MSGYASAISSVSVQRLETTLKQSQQTLQALLQQDAVQKNYPKSSYKAEKKEASRIGMIAGATAFGNMICPSISNPAAALAYGVAEAVYMGTLVLPAVGTYVARKWALGLLPTYENRAQEVWCVSCSHALDAAIKGIEASVFTGETMPVIQHGKTEYRSKMRVNAKEEALAMAQSIRVFDAALDQMPQHASVEQKRDFQEMMQNSQVHAKLGKYIQSLEAPTSVVAYCASI